MVPSECVLALNISSTEKQNLTKQNSRGCKIPSFDTQGRCFELKRSDELRKSTTNLETSNNNSFLSHRQCTNVKWRNCSHLGGGLSSCGNHYGRGTTSLLCYISRSLTRAILKIRLGPTSLFLRIHTNHKSPSSFLPVIYRRRKNSWMRFT